MTTTLLGDKGVDLLIGAFGNDRMVGGDGPDTYQGAEGTDTADFSGEPGPINVTLNGQADDGRLDQDLKDNVAEAEIVIGTTADDTLSAGATAADALRPGRRRHPLRSRQPLRRGRQRPPPRRRRQRHAVGRRR